MPRQTSAAASTTNPAASGQRVKDSQDEAGYWVAQFAHQHDILWDIIARDTLFPLAFVALIVLSLAVRAVVGAERPATQLMLAFFMVGGTLSILNDSVRRRHARTTPSS